MYNIYIYESLSKLIVFAWFPKIMYRRYRFFGGGLSLSMVLQKEARKRKGKGKGQGKGKRKGNDWEILGRGKGKEE